jgi:hypothetical protein
LTLKELQTLVCATHTLTLSASQYPAGDVLRGGMTEQHQA